jgi:hypothetical protein
MDVLVIENLFDETSGKDGILLSFTKFWLGLMKL